jgi:hypothetical protein
MSKAKKSEEEEEGELDGDKGGLWLEGEGEERST